ncbi:MAG: Lrp/AsnC family transcriptional regulator [Nocardioidaceae bacterium]|nr:Lrp/AsnC family transcriptional regulator [Nocardioidaceae bacterium]
MVNQPISLDQLDARLIGALTENPRRGVVDLATAMGVARNTVQARIRRLEESGVLDGFTPQLDLNRIGVAVMAWAALALEQAELDRVVEALVAESHVMEVLTTTGREDLMVRVAAATHAELQGVVQRIVAIPGVSHSNTMIVLTAPLRPRVQPLLDELTKDAGWGRSTALPVGG